MSEWYALLKAQVIVPKHLTQIDRGWTNWFEQVLNEAGYETEPVFCVGKDHAILVKGRKPKRKAKAK